MAQALHIGEDFVDARARRRAGRGEGIADQDNACPGVSFGDIQIHRAHRDIAGDFDIAD